MGKLSGEYPERAREIVTGSFEAVPLDGITSAESTAEGADGWFAGPRPASGSTQVDPLVPARRP